MREKLVRLSGHVVCFTPTTEPVKNLFSQVQEVFLFLLQEDVTAEWEQTEAAVKIGRLEQVKVRVILKVNCFAFKAETHERHRAAYLTLHQKVNNE